MVHENECLERCIELCVSEKTLGCRVCRSRGMNLEVIEFKKRGTRWGFANKFGYFSLCINLTPYLISCMSLMEHYKVTGSTQLIVYHIKWNNKTNKMIWSCWRESEALKMGSKIRFLWQWFFPAAGYILVSIIIHWKSTIRHILCRAAMQVIIQNV